MIIDLILDRKDGMEYNARDFYCEVLGYEDTFKFPEDGINISRAMDGGTNEDVQKELCKYIMQNDYNPQICEYINSQIWVEKLDFSKITVSDPVIKEYRVMYFFGYWITAAKIYAETDNEAIFDAKEIELKAGNKLQYVLFCGNRKVKQLNNISLFH